MGVNPQVLLETNPAPEELRACRVAELHSFMLHVELASPGSTEDAAGAQHPL